MTTNENDLSRGENQPLSETAELPQRPLEDVRATAPETKDIVCKHGTAMDVHCCNCHSGFIFDKDHGCPDV